MYSLAIKSNLHTNFTAQTETTHVLIEYKGVEAVLDEASCTVTVTVPDALENAYIMLKAVRNSDGKYSAQYIKCQIG